MIKGEERRRGEEIMKERKREDEGKEEEGRR